MKKALIIISVLFVISCKTQQETSDYVNTDYSSRAYKKSRKAFKGKLSKEEYSTLIEKIKIALDTTIPKGKIILINYRQYGKNCIAKGYSDKSALNVMDNGFRISTRISLTYNIEDFFVYSEDTFHKNLYLKDKNYIQDTGFFKKTIFTLDENCAAFFIIKPNGDFLKFYGEDYFTEVKNFIKK